MTAPSFFAFYVFRMPDIQTVYLIIIRMKKQQK